MRNDLQLTPWVISQKGSGWIDEFCESIFFIGNGRMGIRGYISSEPAHRPIQKGVYLAGIFGEIKPGITDFVNLPQTGGFILLVAFGIEFQRIAAGYGKEFVEILRGRQGVSADF